MTDRSAPANIDEYIAAFSPEVQSILQRIRLTIREAEEKISYKMPAFGLDGDLIYFAAYKKHIGMYPPVEGDEKLSKELARYRGGERNGDIQDYQGRTRSCRSPATRLTVSRRATSCAA